MMEEFLIESMIFDILFKLAYFLFLVFLINAT